VFGGIGSVWGAMNAINIPVGSLQRGQHPKAQEMQWNGEKTEVAAEDPTGNCDDYSGDVTGGDDVLNVRKYC
jgi:hypothetical protein